MNELHRDRFDYGISSVRFQSIFAVNLNNSIVLSIFAIGADPQGCRIDANVAHSQKRVCDSSQVTHFTTCDGTRRHHLTNESGRSGAQEKKVGKVAMNKT